MNEKIMTLNVLEKLNEDQLLEIYVNAETPKISDMDGVMKGTVLLPTSPIQKLLLNKLNLNMSNPWKGKTFTPLNDVEGTGINQIEIRGEQTDDYIFKYTLGDAIDGKNAVIVLDYNNITNAPNIRFIRDDIKRINHKLFIGRMYSTGLSGYEPVLYFVLQK